MNGVKKSKLWFIKQSELQEVVRESKSIAEICRRLKYEHKGGMHRQVKKVLKERNINFSHISLGIGSNRGKSIERTLQPLSEILVRDKRADGRMLKKRLIKEGLLENKCNKCLQGPIWNGLPLVLQLEHKNGDHDDNRIENLEILCPNCHTQTKTWGYKKRT
jgi:Zn finger protein HypA/HybF involved in hydrogenase expression